MKLKEFVKLDRKEMEKELLKESKDIMKLNLKTLEVARLGIREAWKKCQKKGNSGEIFVFALSVTNMVTALENEIEEYNNKSTFDVTALVKRGIRQISKNKLDGLDEAIVDLIKKLREEGENE